jgi:hypothetical protein
MWYGLSRQNVVHGLIVFSVIGVVAALLGMIGVQFEKPGPRNYWALVFLVAAIPGIWLALVAILTITWLKVDNEQIHWYLWKKIRILSCPISDVTHIGGGSFSAVIIKTRRGTIHLFGLHLRDRGKLSDYLMERNENIQWI